jgi:opacity protein-like surface antigen
MASLTKMAVALSAVVALSSSAAVAAQQEPLSGGPVPATNGETVTMAGSIGLKKIQNDRPMSHAETVAMRK